VRLHQTGIPRHFLSSVRLVVVEIILAVYHSSGCFIDILATRDLIAGSQEELPPPHCAQILPESSTTGIQANIGRVCWIQ
jgi:hypothetical protein